MAKALERFTITRAADEYVLSIEDENGDVIELTASYDQLDLITEELDRALDEDEELVLADDSETDDTKDAEEE
jgi:hypothetical protein